jgi:hypothetical protein
MRRDKTRTPDAAKQSPTSRKSRICRSGAHETGEDNGPAFTGVFEFDLTVEVFGQRVTRKAKAEYEFTPEWEYFDLHKQAPFAG